MPGIDFDRLRAEVTMQQVLQLLGFQANDCRGEQWYGRCPLPACPPSRRPSFSVNVAISRYYCHRCHRHGHQIELWAAATGLLLYPAAIDLCAALGREVPWIDHDGLLNLRQRLADLGGRVELHSAPQAGTCVRIIAPLELPAS